MPILSFFDNNNGALTGWNRMLSATNIPAGSVVDDTNTVVPGVSITVPTTVMYNSGVGGGPASTSGDASWVSPSTHFSDRLQLDTIDSWLPVVYGGLDDETEYLVMVWGWLGSGANRITQGRVNGGSIHTLSTVNNTTNVMSFVVNPVSGNITLELARHSTSSGGPAYAQCVYIGEYVAAPTLIVQNGDLQPGKESEILCTNFPTAPDASTAALITYVNGIATNSMLVSANVTDNLDTTYTVRFTMPAWSTVVGATAASLRTTHVDIPNGINITHKFTINPSA